jgi:hypothetical protein
MDSPEYPALIEKLKPALGGPLAMDHIPFNEDVTNALNAPVTQVITSKLKDGQAKDGLLDAGTFTKALNEAVGAHPPVAFGESKENPGTFIVLIGWDSVEVCPCVSVAHSLLIEQLGPRSGSWAGSPL